MGIGVSGVEPEPGALSLPSAVDSMLRIDSQAVTPGRRISAICEGRRAAGPLSLWLRIHYNIFIRDMCDIRDKFNLIS